MAAQAHAQHVTATWTRTPGGVYSWNIPSNWSSDPYFPNNGNPTGTTYDAVIAPPQGPSNYTIDVSSQRTVNRVTVASADVTLRTSSTTIFTALDGIHLDAGNLRMDSGRLLNTRIAGAGAAQIEIYNNSKLENVTLANVTATVTGSSTTVVDVFNNLTLDNGGILALREYPFASGDATRAIRFNGVNTIGGTGEIVIKGAGASSSLGIPGSFNMNSITTAGTGASLTVGPGVTIRTEGDHGGIFGSVINQGTISAEGANLMLEVHQPVNQGILRARNGGTLNVFGEWTAAPGSGLVIDNGTLNIGGTDKLNSLGTVTRSGGTVAYMGTLNNAGNTLDLSATPAGKLDFTGGATVNGGTLTASNPALGPTYVRRRYSNHQLNGAINFNAVTLDTDLTIERITLFAPNLIVANKTIVIAAGVDSDMFAQTGLTVSGSTLGGSGVIRFDGEGSDNSVSADTIAAGITIRTGTQGGGVWFANNHGMIAAQTPGKTMTVEVGVNAGTIRADAGILRLTGTPTTAGLGNIIRTGGAISIEAAIDNSGATFDTAGLPAFDFLGTITGGNVVAIARPLTIPSPVQTAHGPSGGRARLGSESISAEALTFSGDVHVAAGARLDIDDLVTFNGANIRFTGGDGSRLAITRRNISAITPLGGTAQLTFEGGTTTLQPNSAVPLGSGLTFRTKYSAANVPGSLSVASPVTSSASFSSEVAGGSMTIGGSSTSSRFINNGTIRAQSGGTLALNHLNNNGTIFVGAGSSATVTSTVSNNGTIAGGGTIIGNFASASTIAPGASPGLLNVQGNLTLSNTSVLAIEVGGLVPGEGYDVLDVNGSAALDGVMQITFINGFVPGPHDAFDFFDAASVTGQFDDIIYPTLPPGVVWDEPAMLTGGPTGVPEPSAALLFAAYGARLLTRRRRAR